MFCNQYQERLSDYVDGSLEMGEQAQIEHHLADCDACRAVRDDLLQIAHFSRQLPLHTPSGALWARIQTEIKAEPRKNLLSRGLEWGQRIQNHYFKLSIPQMAAGAVALAVVVSLSAILVSRNDGPATQTGLNAVAQDSNSALNKNLLSNPDLQQIEQRIDQLKVSVEQRKPTWNPELRVAFDRNMFYVDQSLFECREQLSNNPADEVSRELMLNAYREKVRLLESFEKF